MDTQNAGTSAKAYSRGVGLRSGSRSKNGLFSVCHNNEITVSSAEIAL